jgi:three-Cys-motif partner protein
MPDGNDLYLDDGLVLPEVGIWAKTKHEKIAYYAGLFATSMKNKWHCRVYLDLFSCAGKAIVKETGEVVPGSPLLSLGVRDPFDLYLFVEKDHENIDALRDRCRLIFPERNCRFIERDCNRHIADILKEMPSFTKEHTGLTFCFVDPYRACDLEFSTIKQLADKRYMDFLVLIPSFMDINRNAATYIRSDNQVIDRFLGRTTWRECWKGDADRRYVKFGNFIADAFGYGMKAIGYLYEGITDMELVRMGTGNNLPLYHLGFFSKNSLGLRFWRDTRKRTNIQGELDFEE